MSLKIVEPVVDVKSQQAEAEDEKIDEVAGENSGDRDAMREAEVDSYRQKVAGTKIPERLHSKMMDKAQKDGLSPSGYIRRLIVRDLRGDTRPKVLSEDMSRKDARETEGALLDYLDELDLAKEEILDKLDEIRERRAPTPEVDTSAKEALDCLLEVLQNGELAGYDHSFLEEMRRATRNGAIQREKMEELCEDLSKTYNARISPSSLAQTDFIDLAKKTNVEK